MRRAVVVGVLLVLTGVAPAVRAAHLGPESSSAAVRTPRPPRLPHEPSVVRTPAPRVPTGQAPAPSAGTSRPPRSVSDGRRPASDDAPAAVRQRVVRGGPSWARSIALTLDDGYDPDPRILDLVESMGLRGTAFLTGEAATASPWLARRLVGLGWEVCSHTWSHRRLTGVSADTAEREIVRGMRAVEDASGVSCPYFRPPYGSVNATVLRITDRLGLRVVNWNASISDSTPESTPVSLQVEIAMRDIAPGAILLGHFGNTHSYEALSEVLPMVRDLGYHIGTLTELLTGVPHAPPARRARASELPAVAPARPMRVPADLPPEGLVGGGFLATGAMLAATSRLRLGRVLRRAPVAEPVLVFEVPTLSSAGG